MCHFVKGPKINKCNSNVWEAQCKQVKLSSNLHFHTTEGIAPLSPSANSKPKEAQNTSPLLGLWLSWLVSLIWLILLFAFLLIVEAVLFVFRHCMVPPVLGRQQILRNTRPLETALFIPSQTIGLNSSVLYAMTGSSSLWIEEHSQQYLDSLGIAPEITYPWAMACPSSPSSSLLLC